MTKEEADNLTDYAFTCFHGARLLAEMQAKGASWQNIRNYAETFRFLIPEAKWAIDHAEEEIGKVSAFPGLPGLKRALVLKKKPTAHAQALEVLVGLCVRIDKGGLVSQSPEPTYDRDKPVVVELPDGFETLREWIGREAEAIAAAGSGCGCTTPEAQS